jgi:hypothetical protein
MRAPKGFTPRKRRHTAPCPKVQDPILQTQARQVQAWTARCGWRAGIFPRENPPRAGIFDFTKMVNDNTPGVLAEEGWEIGGFLPECGQLQGPRDECACLQEKCARRKGMACKNSLSTPLHDAGKGVGFSGPCSTVLRSCAPAPRSAREPWQIYEANHLLATGSNGRTKIPPECPTGPRPHGVSTTIQWSTKT